MSKICLSYFVLFHFMLLPLPLYCCTNPKGLNKFTFHFKKSEDKNNRKLTHLNDKYALRGSRRCSISKISDTRSRVVLPEAIHEYLYFNTV